jgi:uncharacterized repeat protein (TIGR01451 family)
MKFPTFLTALCLFSSLSLSAQIFDRVYMEQLRLWKTVELADGNLVSLGSTPQTSVLIKTDRNGRLLSTKSLGAGFPNDLQSAGAMYAVVGANILRINPDLTTAWSVTAAGENFKRIRPLSNGQLLTLSDDGANRVSMHILNPQTGATITRKVLVDSFLATRVPEFTVVNDKIYALVNDAVLSFNLNGNLLARLPFAMDNLFDISTATDQTLLVSRGESIIFKIDTLGRQVWRRDIWHKSWSSTKKGDILVVNEINTGRSTGEVSLLDPNGQLKWIRPIGEKVGELPFQARAGIQTKDENVLVVGNTFIPPDSFRTVRSRMVKLGNDNQMYLNRIVGNIYGDRNGNCQKDSVDKVRPYWIVYAKHSNNDLYWGVTDSMGYYSIRCDSGTYTLRGVETPLSPHLKWTNCGAMSKPFIGFGKTDTVNILQGIRDSSGRPTSGCTFLKVDIGGSRYRPCSFSTISIMYQNEGVATAYNAFITVKLDAALKYESASKPLDSRLGNIYKFNIGEIEANHRGFITIGVRAKCPDTVRLGQVICNEAKIFADTSCGAWTGAELSVEGECQSDSVVFTIKNVNNVASQSRKAVIIENNTVTLIPNIQLAGLRSTTRSFPANGNTWRLTVEQESSHPTSFAPTAFVEGCRGNTNLPLVFGYASNFAADDKALSVASACDTVRNSFDPNDKTGYPFGYGDKHFIDQNQDIDYTIRFQNTGNDTAFKVVIRDTLDTRFLDLSSIEFGASSHRYEPTLYDKNILQFTFDNILLVDSFRNEPASNGYVRFRIKQKKDVLIGSKINNSAAIYFDYNPPIITNIALHTVGKPILLTTKIGEINGGNIAVQVSPNPFTEQTIFKVGENRPLSINGRLVRQANFFKNEFVLDRKDLPVGVYIFKIKTMDGRFNSGKVVVQ